MASTIDHRAALGGAATAAPFVFGSASDARPSSFGTVAASDSTSMKQQLLSGMHVVRQQQQQQQHRIQSQNQNRPRFDSTMAMDIISQLSDDDSIFDSDSSDSNSSCSSSYDSSDFDDDSSLCSDFSMLSATADRSTTSVLVAASAATTTGIPTTVRNMLQSPHKSSVPPGEKGNAILGGTKRQFQFSSPALVAMQQLPYQQQKHLQQKQGSTNEPTNVKVTSLIPSSFMQRLKRAVEEEQQAVSTTTPSLSSKKTTQMMMMARVLPKPNHTPSPSRNVDDAARISPSSSSSSKSSVTCEEAATIAAVPLTTADSNVHPHEYYLSLLRTHHNMSQDQVKPIRSMDVAARSSTSSSFFIQLSERNIQAYTLEKMDATRTDNVSKLQECHEAPRNEVIHCCNRYGESIIHTACRRNAIKCLQYLVSTYNDDDTTNDRKRSILQVMDDYGRNPLHDAFWTAQPNYDIVKFVISICPDLLLLQDVRGFCPLHYVRKECWSSWKSFLDENVNLLRPTNQLLE